jgi:hypothetical protein
MTGHISRARPNVDKTMIRDWLNFRQNQIIDRRPMWAGLAGRGVLSIPAAFTTGQITVTNGSNIATGTSTAWPVADVVNTIITNGIQRPGDQWFAPASMNNIGPNSILYVDSAGTAPEIVTVQQVRGTQALAKFQAPHNAGCTATQSSLAGLQLLISTNNPYYTVLGVTSTTSLILDNAWGYTTLTNTGYQIILAYTIFSPDIKELFAVIDPIQPLPLRLHVPQNWLNQNDPIRQNSNSPIWVVDLVPNAQGNMQYELYPPSTVQYSLYFLYYKQWPAMVADGDRPIPFINPAVLIHGALADAFRMKFPVPPKFDDPWYNPQAAEDYEKKFEMGVADLINADNSKAQTDYTWDFGAYGISGANWDQGHAIDSNGDWMV